MGSAHVFGYGSLLLRGTTRGVPCRLRGYRRLWNVAMDNTRDLPGYKFYVDPVTGERPSVMVTFLNIEDDAGGGQVNGVVFTVDGLAALDARERNYRRVDVRGLVSVELEGGPVWAYVGLAEARRRYEVGAAGDFAVIARSYHDDVVAGFEALGPEMLDGFRRTTRPATVPVRELQRIQLPGGRALGTPDPQGSPA